MLFVAASVSPSAVGDLRSIFYYWRSVLIENARKQAFLGLVFSCFAFFDVFAFRKPSRTGVCGGVLATARRFDVLRQVLQGGLASGGLVRVGSAGSSCTGSALPGWLCRVGLRRPSGSHKGLRWSFSRIFAQGIPCRKTY